LTIRFCHSISDVSSLTSVHSLTIEKCHQLSDISR
jgi:hypothetical protein